MPTFLNFWQNILKFLWNLKFLCYNADMKTNEFAKKLDVRSQYRKNQKFRFICEILGVALGAIICGMAYPTFCSPANIIPSGLTGLAVIIAEALGIGQFYSIVYLVINVVLFLIALKLFGWKFIVFTLVGIGAYTLAIEFFAIPGIANVNPEEVMTSYRLLYCLIGGGIAGVGQGIAFRLGGSTGGSDIAAKIINKFFPRIKTGIAVLIINFIVVVTTILYTSSWIAGLYAVIFSVISTITCDMVLDGAKSVRAFYIICDKDDEVAHAILARFHRGVTVMPAQGKFSGKDKKMLLCLIANTQAREMKEIVKNIDRNAFVFSTAVSETLGDGYFMKEASVRKSKIKESQNLLKQKEKLQRLKTRPKQSFGKKFKVSNKTLQIEKE